MEPLAAGDPREVGVYRLRFRLGAGGMGRVFLGFSPAGRAVAVKIVYPDLARDPEFVHRFRREVRAAEAVSGAYTAPVVAAGPDDDPPWLATAFIAGPSLADLIEQAGPLPEAAVWRLTGGLIEALQAVHTRGLVHRDLKPTNMLLAADGPRVIDFGISRALEGTVVTASRVIMGTPGFMSPEQLQGLPVGFPSDVFALGAVIVFAATGVAPFGSGEPVAMAYRMVHAPPELGGMPVSLRNLVARCLAKAPADRPPLTGLLDAVMAHCAVGPGVSSADFWPEPVAGLIRAYQDSFRTQVASRAEGGRVPVMSSLPHEPTALAWAGSSADREEATRTATSLPGIHAKPLADQAEPPANELILPNPGTAQAYETGAINRVPRSEAEQQQLLLERPYAWEYLYFASRLLQERNAVEDRYRGYLKGCVLHAGEVVSHGGLANYTERVMRDTVGLVTDLGRIMNDSDAKERAFGPPGVEGDPKALAQFAKSMSSLYEAIIDWAERVRGVSRPSEYDRYIELLVGMNDSAISEYRKWVDDLVAHNDGLPARIVAGEPSVFENTLTFTVPEEATNALNAELARICLADLTRHIRAERPSRN
jgi:serine/threonine protein kinase